MKNPTPEYIQHLNKIKDKILEIQNGRGTFFISDNPDFQVKALMELFANIPVDEHGHNAEWLKGVVEDFKQIRKADVAIEESQHKIIEDGNSGKGK